MNDGRTTRDKFEELKDKTKYKNNEHFKAAWKEYKKQYMKEKPPPPPLLPSSYNNNNTNNNHNNDDDFEYINNRGTLHSFWDY